MYHREHKNRSELKTIFDLSPIPCFHLSAARTWKWFGKQVFWLFDVCQPSSSRLREHEANLDPIPETPATHPALLVSPGTQPGGENPQTCPE